MGNFWFGGKKDFKNEVFRYMRNKEEITHDLIKTSIFEECNECNCGYFSFFNELEPFQFDRCLDKKQGKGALCERIIKGFVFFIKVHHKTLLPLVMKRFISKINNFSFIMTHLY